MVKVKTLDTANNYIVAADSLSNNVVIRIFRFVNYRLENCTAIYDFKVPSSLQFNSLFKPCIYLGLHLEKSFDKVGDHTRPNNQRVTKKIKSDKP